MKKSTIKDASPVKTVIQKKYTPVRNIDELPPKRSPVSGRKVEEEILENEQPVPEIEKTHKHIHKIQTPAAGINDTRNSIYVESELSGNPYVNDYIYHYTL